jgi:hypothetical protein
MAVTSKLTLSGLPLFASDDCTGSPRWASRQIKSSTCCGISITEGRTSEKSAKTPSSSGYAGEKDGSNTPLALGFGSRVDPCISFCRMPFPCSACKGRAKVESEQPSLALQKMEQEASHDRAKKDQ